MTTSTTIQDAIGTIMTQIGHLAAGLGSTEGPTRLQASNRLHDIHHKLHVLHDELSLPPVDEADQGESPPSEMPAG